MQSSSRSLRGTNQIQRVVVARLDAEIRRQTDGDFGCIKQVPDTTEIRIDPETNTLIRTGVPSIMNPFDAYAVEQALQLKR